MKNLVEKLNLLNEDVETSVVYKIQTIEKTRLFINYALNHQMDKKIVLRFILRILF